MDPAHTEQPGKVDGNFSDSQLNFLMKDMHNQLCEKTNDCSDYFSLQE